MWVSGRDASYPAIGGHVAGHPRSLAGDERWEVWELPEDIDELRDGLLALWLGAEKARR
jgi:hypothetical protein